MTRLFWRFGQAGFVFDFSREGCQAAAVTSRYEIFLDAKVTWDF